MHVKAKNLPTYAIFVVIHFGCGVHLTKGMENCDYEECVCDPDEPAFFRCIPPKSHGELCNSDQECQLSDYNLHCVKSETRICKCKRSYVWDSERKKCLPTLDEDIYIGRFDPVRDLVIPAIIIVTIGAMAYLGFKLFCNCGKLWRRRRHQEITRELEEISATPHQQATWIASYRVFSPYNNTTRPPPGAPPTSFPLGPRPCMGLFVPSQLTTSPPSYEEALKHKVILSSYHPTPQPQPPGPVPAFALPPADLPRPYQTLPANATASSSAFVLNPNLPAASAIRISAVSGHRSLPIPQSDSVYPGLSASQDPIWSQHLYPGGAGPVWNPHHPSSLPRMPHHEPATHGDLPEALPQQHLRGGHPVEVWQQQQVHGRGPGPQQPLSITQQMDAQTRASTFRPSHPARMYQSAGSEVVRAVQSNSDISR